MMDRTQDQAWERFHQAKVAGNYPRWPNEIMLKLAFGSYLERPIRLPDSARVLDVGCGFGNNLLPFLDAGRECFGTEVTADTASLAQRILAERGHQATIKAGHNRQLDFPDNYFDLLLSIGVIHYEGGETEIRAALREYDRVLRPGGALLLLTVGPEHDIAKRAEAVGPHLYKIRNYDFRDGQTFFFFETEAYLSQVLAERFAAVETGRVKEDLMRQELDFLVAAATTPEI